MTTGTKLSYYPGCTLKTKARNLEEAALGALTALGIEYRELDRWNCCGAVFSLADDDLIHHVAPVRNLIRAAEQGSDTIVTLCSHSTIFLPSTGVTCAQPIPLRVPSRPYAIVRNVRRVACRAPRPGSSCSNS